MNEAEKRQNEYINQTAERVENRYDFKKAEIENQENHHETEQKKKFLFDK